MYDPLPPIWGRSYWWTRAGYVAGLLTIAVGVLMTAQLGKHLGSCRLPGHLTRPGLAIQLADDWPIVLAIVGPCESPGCLQSQTQQACVTETKVCKLVCPDKIEALVVQQRWDRLFIPLYWCLFMYLATINFRFTGPLTTSDDSPWWVRWATLGRILGIVGGLLVVPTATVAAWFDWIEDDRIVAALQVVQRNVILGSMPAIRGAAYHKWLFLFIAIGFSAPVFLFWPGRANGSVSARKSLFSLLLAWMTAVAALMAASTGLAACRFGQDERLETAAGALFLTLPLATLTLATAQYWRGGTLNALNKLAALPGLNILGRLLSDDAEGPAPDSNLPREPRRPSPPTAPTAPVG